MTAPVSPLVHALRLLKVELAQARNAPAGQRSAVNATNEAAALSTAVGATALRGLPSKLKAISARNGSLARAKALRLFVEAALLDEMGHDLQLDPAFGDLVERTCRAIEQDQDNADLLAEALQELQGLAG
jgi:hypothetical protein